MVGIVASLILLTLLIWGGTFVTIEVVGYAIAKRRENRAVKAKPVAHRKNRVALEESIEKLEKWNTEWCHPDLGDFYKWDDEHGYMEHVTKSIYRIPQSDDIFIAGGIIDHRRNIDYPKCHNCNIQMPPQRQVTGYDLCRQCFKKQGGFTGD